MITPRSVGPDVALTQAMHGSAQHYRADVDGLRALAIIAVLLFHAEIPGFAGGFVGVDVFFVISGYLITRQVRLDQLAGVFRFADFYRRRARRLLPAAASTILGTLVAGTFLLSPNRLRDLAESAMAASVSVANLYFGFESGYWAPKAAERPLLHTWSLGVEEQFYLIWPLLLILLLRWRRGRHAGIAMAIIALVSLMGTWALTERMPTVAFYVMPARIYEFAIGAGCVWLESRRSSETATGLRAFQWLVGVGLVAFSVFTFDSQTVFPGAAAAIPAVGTAMVILAARPAPLDALFSNAAAVAIGRRSYSLYLVHWPVLVLWRLEYGTLTPTGLVVVLFVTVAMTHWQYQFIELRFRARSRTVTTEASQTRPGRVWPILVVSVCVTLVGALLVAADGLPQRLPPSLRTIATASLDDVNDARTERTRAICGGKAEPPVCGRADPSRPNVLVLGDSIAPDGVNMVVTAMPDANLLVASRGGCPPFPVAKARTPLQVDCQRHNGVRLPAVAALSGEVQTLVLAAALTKERVTRTADLVRWLVEAGYEHVVVLGVGPAHPFDVRDEIVEVGLMEAQRRAQELLTAENLFGLSAKYRAAVEAAGGRYLDRLGWMCPEQRCLLAIPGTVDELIIFDHHHFTRAAADAFGRTIPRAVFEAR